MIELRGPARRYVWRLGRKLYCAARGEGANRIEINGEAYVQRCVIAGTGSAAATVFDVGANLGDWTESWVSACHAAGREDYRLWAFEPVPETHGMLAKRFAENDRITAENLALSDSEGTAEMLVTSATAGTNTLAFGQTAEGAATVSVPTRSAARMVDELGLDGIQLLKADTEGHDLKVIRGAMPLLDQERVDALQFEYNHRWIHGRAFFKDVFDLFQSGPYRIYRIRRQHLELLPDWHPELERFFEANFLVLHDRARPWFEIVDGAFDVSNTYA